MRAGVDRAQEALRFFENLYGGNVTRLATATMSNRGKSNQRFNEAPSRLRVGDDEGAAMGRLQGMIRKATAGEDIFYAPTPMKGPAGRKKEQALPSRIVFGDADGGITDMAKARLVELGACLVRSGGLTDDNKPKYHVYIRLTRAVPPTELETLNRALKRLIQGDKWDATTLLRVPGTINHKYPSKPMVIIERLADSTVTPENLAKFLNVDEGDTPTSSGVVDPKLPLPQIPPDFRFLDPARNARLRSEVRQWNQRLAAGNVSRRYLAVVALCKEGLKRSVSLDEIYAFAMSCEPLLEKQEEENGYSIQKDVYRTYHRLKREAAKATPTPSQTTLTTPSGETLDKPTDTRAVDAPAPKIVPPTFAGVPVFGESFPFKIPNLDEILAGDYKPLEPTWVPCGSFHLLYPGKSHSLVADRGMGKTHVAIAMVHEIMKAGGRVVYFDFEDTAETFILDRMVNQHGISAEMIKTQFLYVNGMAPTPEAGDYDEVTAIVYMAQMLEGWDVCFIDGVSASMGDWSSAGGAPAGGLDGAKDTDYKWWYARQVQPFLDHGFATLQLDHSTKSGPRAGGTIQKGAKLTGVEYQLRTTPANAFTIGRTGQVILEAAKDRVGRIAKHRRQNPPSDDAGKTDEYPYNDVATFTLASDGEGKITRAVFEPINYQDSNEATGKTQGPPPLTEKQTMVIKAVQAKPGFYTPTKAATDLTGGKAALLAVIKGLVADHYLSMSDGKLYPASDNPEPSPTNGPTEFDFGKHTVPSYAKRQKECGACGDNHWWPVDFVEPDEIGYDPQRALCRTCADDPIARGY